MTTKTVTGKIILSAQDKQAGTLHAAFGIADSRMTELKSQIDALQYNDDRNPYQLIEQVADLTDNAAEFAVLLYGVACEKAVEGLVGSMMVGGEE